MILSLIVVYVSVSCTINKKFFIWVDNKSSLCLVYAIFSPAATHTFSFLFRAPGGWYHGHHFAFSWVGQVTGTSERLREREIESSEYFLFLHASTVTLMTVTPPKNWPLLQAPSSHQISVILFSSFLLQPYVCNNTFCCYLNSSKIFLRLHIQFTSVILFNFSHLTGFYVMPVP